MERLDLGPRPMLKLNERLIYARLTGFGQEGLYSKRAGHDINYLAVSGVLSLFCSNGRPTPPINMLADFAGGGMTCALGILIALWERSRSNCGQVVDVSMVEGVRYLSTYMWHTQKDHALARSFIWPNRGEIESNLLDGGAHFYTVYETKDNRWIAVGAIEPQFYSALIGVLGVDETEYPQFEINRWADCKKRFAGIFKEKTLEEWKNLFRNVDACVEPVLNYDEAECFDKDSVRVSFNDDHTPRPAPLLSRTPAVPNLKEPSENEHTAEVLREHGYSNEEIRDFVLARVIDCNVIPKL